MAEFEIPMANELAARVEKYAGVPIPDINRAMTQVDMNKANANLAPVQGYEGGAPGGPNQAANRDRQNGKAGGIA